MKKSVFLTILILFSTHFLFSQEVKIIESILIEHVDLKVEKVQKNLQLSDFEVREIKKIELECLQKIQKLESRKRCNLQKRTQKLVIERDERLKKILSHENFLKYLIIEKGELERFPMQSD